MPVKTHFSYNVGERDLKYFYCLKPLIMKIYFKGELQLENIVTFRIEVEHTTEHGQWLLTMVVR
jgi:hypothetical protein